MASDLMRYVGVVLLNLWSRIELRDEEGATAVEYGLMVALIAAVIIVAVTALGNNANSKFTTVGNAIGAAS